MTHEYRTPHIAPGFASEMSFRISVMLSFDAAPAIAVTSLHPMYHFWGRWSCEHPHPPRHPQVRWSAYHWAMLPECSQLVREAQTFLEPVNVATPYEYGLFAHATQ